MPNRDSDKDRASWITPSARDWKDSPGMATTGTNPDGTTRSRMDQLPRQAAGVLGPEGQPATGLLNPSFVGWLTGEPRRVGSVRTSTGRLLASQPPSAASDSGPVHIFHKAKRANVVDFAVEVRIWYKILCFGS